MRILLTNDDGFDAQGLRILERIAATLGEDIWTVAPQQEQSGTSRALTLSLPVRLRQHGDKRFSVAGTPTDCVRIAVLDLMKDCRPDLILSGVNRGQNVGEDLALSGTIAAAIQGSALGVPAFALSQAIETFGNRDEADWSSSESMAAELIAQILKQPSLASSVLNINFPACQVREVAGVAITRQGFHEQSCARVERRSDPRGDAYFWMCFDDDLPSPCEETDVAALKAHLVSITPIVTDLTDHRVRGAIGTLTLPRTRLSMAQI